MPSPTGAFAPIAHGPLEPSVSMFGALFREEVAERNIQSHELPPQVVQEVFDYLQDDSGMAAAIDYIEDDRSAPPDWSEEDIVNLHWRLLLELRRLPDPETPLEEKLDTLAWALTDPDLDDRPFSFANCLRVVGTSPLSPTAYFGALNVEDVRDWLRRNAKTWLRATLERFPRAVQELVREQPDWVAQQLNKNPQWINQQIRRQAKQGQDDMFGWRVAHGI